MEGIRLVPLHDEAVVVELRGEHDIATRAGFSSLLDDLVRRNEMVVVDLSNVEFVDSTILDALVKADNAARLSGRRFVLQLGTTTSVRMALEVSGLLGYLTCTSSRQEALAQPSY
jgi:anti-anti-sigma factor